MGGGARVEKPDSVLCATKVLRVSLHNRKYKTLSANSQSVASFSRAERAKQHEAL